MPHAAHPRLLREANSGVREQFSSPFAKANLRSRLSSSRIKTYSKHIMVQTAWFSFTPAGTPRGRAIRKMKAACQPAAFPPMFAMWRQK
jgi:hypothetical protein